jgi:hypothetical protein
VRAALWPAAGQQLTVVVDGGHAQRCVVDDVRPPDCLVLREPVSITGEPPVGGAVHLFWSSSAGRHELLTTLARQTWDQMPLWELHVSRDPSVRQERAFARAADALPCQLLQDERRWRAIVVDLSEGGARCVVHESEGLASGASVELHLALEGRELTLPAEVLSVKPGTEDRWEVRLRFVGLGRLSDLLRRRVMEQQRRARSVARA